MGKLVKGLLGLLVVGAAIFLGFQLVAYVQWRGTLAQMRQIDPPAPMRIERDAWGVPTIYGETDPATAYGLAYAHAEDDFATIQRQALGVRGLLGAVQGPAGAQVDFFGKLIDVEGQLDAALQTLAPEARAMAAAYAAGLNRYAADHPDEVLYRPLFPVCDADIIGGFVLVSPLFFGLDDVVAALVAGREPPVASVLPPRGSNAFAFSPARTADGATVLVSNSHQPWEGAAAWYEARVASGEGWAMAGALFPGSPVILMGHNAHLGWTNTVNRPDLIDVYELVLDESGDRYRLDGDWLPLEAKRVWLTAKIGGLPVPVPRTVYRSVHGPVIKNDAGAFAIRYAGMGEVGHIEQYYKLGRTRSLEDWRDVMAMQAIPATNFVYADKAGNIALLYNARFPRRDPSLDWTGVLPGDQAALIWSEYEPPERIPFLLNPPSGYVLNANNTPLMATAAAEELDLDDYPGLVGVETYVTNRILRARALVEADDSLTMADIRRIKFDKGYDRASPIGRALTAMLNQIADDRSEGARLLRAWDWTLDGEGEGDALAALSIAALFAALRSPDQTPPGPQILEKATAYLTSHFGALDVALGDLIRLRRGVVDLPLTGGPDAMRALRWQSGEDGRLAANFGDSFILIARWAADGTLSSQTIYPYGAAMGRPDSPHFADQAALYAEERFKTVVFPEPK